MKRSWVRVSVLAVVVALLLVGVAAVLRRSAGIQTVDDPRSVQPQGTAALAALLRAEGIRLRTVRSVDAAVSASSSSTLLVVANPDRLSPDDARRVRAAGAGRLLILRPTERSLADLGLSATTAASAQGRVLTPSCTAQPAALAGAIQPGLMRAAVRPDGVADLACYPTADGGYAYLRVDGVDLVTGAVTNTELTSEGNAAFAMNVFGSQPQLVWLLTPPVPPPATPTPLPSWWSVGVAQAFVALVVLGIWRGRRLGPIISEQLPVTVRASETVVGHGRLYHRLQARDRAAAALRSGSRSRLARWYGHRDDPIALSAAVAARTGAAEPGVRSLLAGPDPTTDEELTELARRLDRLEQEARSQ